MPEGVSPAQEEALGGTEGTHRGLLHGALPPRPQLPHGLVSLERHGLQHHLLLTQLPLRLLELGGGLGDRRDSVPRRDGRREGRAATGRGGRPACRAAGREKPRLQA